MHGHLPELKTGKRANRLNHTAILILPVESEKIMNVCIPVLAGASTGWRLRILPNHEANTCFTT